MLSSNSLSLFFAYLTSLSFIISSFFFFNDTATTEIYTLSLHDALPICVVEVCYIQEEEPEPCDRLAQFLASQGEQAEFLAGVHTWKEQLAVLEIIQGNDSTTLSKITEQILCPGAGCYGGRDDAAYAADGCGECGEPFGEQLVYLQLRDAHKSQALGAQRERP